MADGTYKQCDQCNHKEEYQDHPIMFGSGSFTKWIIVTRGQSSSGDIIGAGKYLFCSDKCLSDYMISKTEPTKEDAIKAKKIDRKKLHELLRKKA